jgi:hypothetical protein
VTAGAVSDPLQPPTFPKGSVHALSNEILLVCCIASPFVWTLQTPPPCSGGDSNFRCGSFGANTAPCGTAEGALPGAPRPGAWRSCLLSNKVQPYPITRDRSPKVLAHACHAVTPVAPRPIRCFFCTFLHLCISFFCLFVRFSLVLSSFDVSFVLFLVDFLFTLLSCHAPASLWCMLDGVRA